MPIATIKPEHLPEVCRVLEDRQVFNCAQHEAKVRRFGDQTPGHERLPLMDEDGYEFGRVLARIPTTEFFQLMQQKNFGYEGLNSDEGLRDLLRDRPHCRVKTVSGKTVVGYGDCPSNRQRPGRGRWAL